MQTLDSSPVPLADLYHAAVVSKPRSEGWHVTDLLNLQTIILGGRTPDYSSLSMDVPNMGLLWEVAVRAYLIKWGQEIGLLYLPIEESEYGGVYFSPDGILVSPKPGKMEPLGVTEVKFKFTMRDPDPSQNRRWMQQTQAYCKGLGTRDVFFLVGQVGTNPPQCQVLRYHYRFDQEEIDSTWAGIDSALAYANAHGIEAPPQNRMDR